MFILFWLQNSLYTELIKTVLPIAGSYVNAGDVQNFYNKLFLMEPDTGSNTGGANVNMYNPWFTKYWEETFECSFEAGTCDLANQRLETKIDRSEAYVPFTLMAVDAIIRGVKAAAERRCGNIHVCSNLLNPGNSRGNDLYNCKLHFDSFCILLCTPSKRWGILICSMLVWRSVCLSVEQTLSDQ